MTDVVAGIKEEELQALSLEILRYHDSIGVLFGEIDKYMDLLPDCYQGPPSKKITAKYEKLSAQYENVKSNLKNYSKDLQAVIAAMKAGEKRLAFLFESFNSENRQLLKSIDSKKSPSQVYHRKEQ